ncbi:calcium/proton exchanger [Sediminicoccus sp. KRV36]|uniref:calcium/proton exchanger n=1 Tax=Sediminicoccus sp. KRV36 TaxID=3133721 RepID=UPI0020105090|nr:calcium/proton exchanger [Sediminicoccus rosea]UPY39403.1 calcium/proton exchanger [Sediminicoccus rosea]
MRPLWLFIRQNPLLWLLVFVPAVLLAEHLRPEAATLLFILAVLAIIPLAALLSRATEAVAARTGDTVGGLLNATLGNLTELVIAMTALAAGEYMLVKASIAGAIVTNTLFMLGASLLLGGLRHHTQSFQIAGARLQASQLFLATIALLVPSSVVAFRSDDGGAGLQDLSLLLAVLLIGIYGLGLVFSLRTHREIFQGADHAAVDEDWPISLAMGTLACVTLLVAWVSEIFVGSVQEAAAGMGMSDAFVGFVVVSLVGGAAEMTSAFSAARKNRLDLSIGIALGSASQIALFVAPMLVLASYVIGPSPMDLHFWMGAVIMIMLSTLTALIICGGGRTAWFSGALVLGVYFTFAAALYLVPPGPADRGAASSGSGVTAHR